MITFRPMTPADASIFRDVRLGALLDAPQAFGSTDVMEASFTDEQWIERTKQRSDPLRFVTFLAFGHDFCRGIVSCCMDGAITCQAWIISMWVSPEVRRGGVGVRLLQMVEDWARAVGLT